MYDFASIIFPKKISSWNGDIFPTDKCPRRGDNCICDAHFLNHFSQDMGNKSNCIDKSLCLVEVKVSCMNMTLKQGDENEFNRKSAQNKCLKQYQLPFWCQNFFVIKLGFTISIRELFVLENLFRGSKGSKVTSLSSRTKMTSI